MHWWVEIILLNAEVLHWIGVRLQRMSLNGAHDFAQALYSHRKEGHRVGLGRSQSRARIFSPYRSTDAAWVRHRLCAHLWHTQASIAPTRNWCTNSKRARRTQTTASGFSNCTRCSNSERLSWLLLTKLATVKPLITELVEEDELREVAVDGWTEKAFVHRNAKLSKQFNAAALLSPFDSLVWCRQRNERLFNFH